MSEREFDRIIDEQADNLFEDECGSYLPTNEELTRWVEALADEE